MSSEIIWGDQIPERLLKSEYWGGHDLEDDCEWLESTVRNRKAFDEHHNQFNRTLKAVFEASWDYASDFWQKKTSVVLSEFRDGIVFDGRAYNPGTVIKSHSEILFQYNHGNFGYYEIALLGVVCDVKQKDGLERAIAIYNETPSGNLNLMGWNDPAIEVGQVGHTRIANHYLSKASNNMERVIKVELLQAGLGETKKAEEKKRVLIPRFSFAPQHG